MTNNNEPGKVRLAPGMTAEPGTCGSCVYFRRSNDWKDVVGGARMGECTIVLPPFLKNFHRRGRIEGICGEPTEIFENSSDVRHVDDSEVCSFWKSSGSIYVQDRVWSADGRPVTGER